MGAIFDGTTISGTISDIQIKPVKRGELVVKPVIGDGVFVKRGQLEPGSVSFSVTTETDTEVGVIAFNLSRLTGYMSTLVVDGMGAWNSAMLTDIGTLTAKRSKTGKVVISYTLDFTIYP